MKKLNVKNELEVHASVAQAWEVVGPNFLNVADWARGVRKSWNHEAARKDFSDAPAGGRHCDISGFGRFDETITHFDAGEHQITWSATGEKLPTFLSGLQNAVTVEQIDQETCRITSNITGDLTGMRGWLFGSMVEKNFAKTVTGFLKDWKVYAETGHVSDAKQRELSRG